MNVIHRERCLCPCCMEEHEVKTIRIEEQTSFKKMDIEYEAVYSYCDVTDELFMTESQIRENDVVLKDTYRKRQGLLTSGEIINIRRKYGISQTDFCVLLGWGGKTITRYEGHQVQDKAHDAILKKVYDDPQWYLSLLEGAKNNISESVYQRYYQIAIALYEESQDIYLRKMIGAKYARFQDETLLNGNMQLSLDRVVDVIRYFSSSKLVTCLYKVKLMKLMWYADSLSYKKRGCAITGLVYRAMPMGAVPIGHEAIINLKGVPCEEVDMGESCAYHFSLDGRAECSSLTKEDIEILDIIIATLGTMSKKEIVDLMHSEQAYLNTNPREIISFIYAKKLQIA